MRAFGTSSILGLIAAALTVIGLPMSAHALEDRSWTVESHAGTVSVRRGGVQPIALNPTQSLGAGSTIETGADGRVVLVRGDETIIISPNTSIALPEENDSGMATTILQSFGTILLQVEKRASQHFEVETPFLAAVVKGTRFTVTVNQGGAAVHVVEGAVEVLDLDTGDIGMVRPGQTAHSPAAQGVGLSLGGPGALPPARAAVPAQPNKPVPAPTERRADNRPAAPADPIVLASVGPARLDVNTTTNGLARAATVSNGRISAPEASADANTAPDGNTGNRSNARTSSGNTDGLTSGASSGNGVSNGRGAQVAMLTDNGLSGASGSNGLAVGRTGTPPGQSGLSNAGGNGNGLALGHSNDTGSGLSSSGGGGNGLAVGQTNATPPGLDSSNGNGLAVGQSGGTPPGLANNPSSNAGGNGNGLSVGQSGATPPGLANNPSSNAGGNGNSNAGGNGNGLAVGQTGATPPGLVNNPNANAGGNGNGNGNGGGNGNGNANGKDKA